MIYSQCLALMMVDGGWFLVVSLEVLQLTDIFGIFVAMTLLFLFGTFLLFAGFAAHVGFFRAYVSVCFLGFF